MLPGQNSRPHRTKALVMRPGRFGRFLLRPSLLLTVLGVVIGFSVTMCIQSLSCVSIKQHHTDCVIHKQQQIDGQSSYVHISFPPSPPIPYRHLLLVGVMTAQKYVNTRALTVWRTWAQNIPGKVIFFVAEHTQIDHSDMPVIRLNGVDDTYPPQKKAFMMLRWMAENAIDQYEWFLRGDDDLYVRGDKLEVFLRSLDSRRPLFIGQAGQGTSEEYGQLSLADNENYCMGGPGVILSHETLHQLKPHLAQCLSNMYTTHEDVEVGRCVRKYVGVACTWSYEMQTIFYNNKSVTTAYSGDLNVPEVHQAITLHPLKNITAMRRLHNFALGLKTGDLRFRSVQLSRDVMLCIDKLDYKQTSNAGDFRHRYSIVGLPPSLLKFSPSDHREILAWDFVSSTNIRYCTDKINCPRHSAESYLKYATVNAVRQIFDFFNRNARQRGRLLKFQNMQYSYHRVDPLHGADYIFDMILLFQKFRGRRATIPVRRHAYVQQSFASLEAIDDDEWRRIQHQRLTLQSLPGLSHVYDSTEPQINFILPLAGRLNTFVRFVENFESVCFNEKQSLDVTLTVVLFQAESRSEQEGVLNLLRSLQSKYSKRVIRWLEINDRTFSRGLALSRGAASMSSSQSLLFFTDVDIIFTADALYRIRKNTVLGGQIYYPIVFSEFAPETWSQRDRDSRSEHFQYGTRRGYFRHFGFGLVSLYGRDLDTVGGFDTDIKGWGLEDVDLFEKCIKSKNINVFRAPEPGLVHVYHPVNCPKEMPSSQYKMCVGSRAQSYASIETLAQQIYQFNQTRYEH